MADKRLVEYVADLARLEVSPQERGVLADQLAKIIGYIDKLKELDVSKVEPMRGAIVQRDVLRQDQACVSDLGQDILKNAPSREGDYFKVPKIIE